MTFATHHINAGTSDYTHSVNPLRMSSRWHSVRLNRMWSRLVNDFPPLDYVPNRWRPQLVRNPNLPPVKEGYPKSLAALLDSLYMYTNRRRFYTWLRKNGWMEDLEMPYLSFALKHPTTKAVEAKLATRFDNMQNEFTLDGLATLLECYLVEIN